MAAKCKVYNGKLPGQFFDAWLGGAANGSPHPDFEHTGFTVVWMLKAVDRGLSGLPVLLSSVQLEELCRVLNGASVVYHAVSTDAIPDSHNWCDVEDFAELFRLHKALT